MDQLKSNIYVFKVTLKDSKPAIWRRIQLPATSTFKQLHELIAVSMKRSGMHLHRFELCRPGSRIAISIANKAQLETHSVALDPTRKVIDENEAVIAEYFTTSNRSGRYIYDFGDNWEHTVRFEKSIKEAPSNNARRCLDGKGLSPPESCGGITRYYRILRALSNPQDPEHAVLKQLGVHIVVMADQLSGKKFDPSTVDASQLGQ